MDISICNRCCDTLEVDADCVFMQVIRHRTLSGIRQEPEWELTETHYRLSDSWLDAGSRNVTRPAATAINMLQGEQELLPCGVTAKARWGGEPDAASEDQYVSPWDSDTWYSDCETEEAEDPRDRRRASSAIVTQMLRCAAALKMSSSCTSARSGVRQGCFC